MKVYYRMIYMSKDHSKLSLTDHLYNTTVKQVSKSSVLYNYSTKAITVFFKLMYQ